MALVRAVPLKDFRLAANALSTTGVSTGLSLGTTAGSLIYAGLHITNGYGSTDRQLSMVIQSASSSGFGAPTARVTFGLTTCSAYGIWSTQVPQSTDQPWFRASWTLSTTLSTNGAWQGLIHVGLK